VRSYRSQFIVHSLSFTVYRSQFIVHSFFTDQFFSISYSIISYQFLCSLNLAKRALNVVEGILKMGFEKPKF